MRALAVATLASACGGAVAVPPPPTPPAIEVAVPGLPHSDFVVVPAELNDPGIAQRIPHRTRVRHIGSSWLREDGEVMRGNKKEVVQFVLPVISESATKLRIAFEDDKARLAIWISRDDAWDTTAVPIAMSDREGTTRRDAGIWLREGAPLEPSKRDGARRYVKVRDPLLTFHGFVPERVLAKVWIAGASDPPLTFDTKRDPRWELPPDKRPHVRFKAGTHVRVAAEPNAASLVVVDSEEVIGFVGNDLGVYRHVEIARPFARIKGYVLATDVHVAKDEFGTIGTGRGHGFGISHADKIDVPAGACLYDQVKGEVVGVQTEPSTRLGRAKLPDSPGWSIVNVGTHWAITKVYIRDTSDDPKQPKWETCTRA